MLISEAVFGVLDCETTGLDPAVDKVVELAVVPCATWGPVGIGSTLSKLFNPGIPIPAAASAIHHITDEDVSGKPTFGPLEFRDFYYVVYAAHNAAFDSQFIPLDRPIICTMRLAKKLWPTLDGFGNQFLRHQLKLEIPAEVKAWPMHRALPDAVITAFLLKMELETLAQVHPELTTVEELVQWLAKPTLLYRCNFGKHGPKDGKPGVLWSEVPRDYLGWMHKNMTDMDADLSFTVRHYLGK